jgi:Tfp pilus assembly protein PilX
VAEAEIFRRGNARKRAEEAGTRLILPMVLMMMVVFAVLMIPAFLSMNL